MEHKTLSFEIKAVDYTGRTLEGYAAAFGNLDQVGDIIHPGAFSKTLAERGGKIKVLWQHDPNEPIGKLVEAREEPRGLFVKAVISDTARGRDALALLKDGAIGEMSIGYDAVKGGVDYSTTSGKSVRNLREIKLYEFSLVTFPANEAAVVTAIKQQDVEPEEGKPWRAVRDGDVWKVYKLDAEGEPTGEALGEHESQEEAQSQVRALYASEADGKKDEQPAPEVKVGRTLSAANVTRIKRALEALEEALSAAGVGDMDEMEEEMMDKSAPAGVPQAAVIEQETAQAGPVGEDQPESPTSRERKLRLIEIEQQHLENLEVLL